uniref:HTH_Tnp_Tc3_1 domain-containing protein n=1 Tax=Caenorhabditis japonica TaxID=281687 RepID=A0A8R1E5M7_CAEJA
MDRAAILFSPQQAQLDLIHRMGYSYREMARQFRKSRSAITHCLKDPVNNAPKLRLSTGRKRKLTNRDVWKSDGLGRFLRREEDGSSIRQQQIHSLLVLRKEHQGSRLARMQPGF